MNGAANFSIVLNPFIAPYPRFLGLVLQSKYNILRLVLLRLVYAKYFSNIEL